MCGHIKPNLLIQRFAVQAFALRVGLPLASCSVSLQLRLGRVHEGKRRVSVERRGCLCACEWKAHTSRARAAAYFLCECETLLPNRTSLPAKRPRFDRPEANPRARGASAPTQRVVAIALGWQCARVSAVVVRQSCCWTGQWVDLL